MTASILFGKGRRASRGFSLLEVAVALFIVALLLGSILVPLGAQVENRKYDETRRILDQARDALLGYAAAYGYLPCPADYAEVSSGKESTSANHSTGNCGGSTVVDGGGTSGVYIGYLPAATLGLTTAIDSSGYALDAWGLTQNRVRYAVSYTTVGSENRPFTKQNGIRNAGMSGIMNTTLLSVCSAAPSPTSATTCNPASTTLTSNAIAVIWSVGPNAATTGGVSTAEAKNAQILANADRVFVSKEKSNVTGSEFDDVVTWISPPMLFNKLLAAGQLP